MTTIENGEPTSNGTQPQDLLISLGLLPNPAPQKVDGETITPAPPAGPFSDTDPEFQVLKSGVTKLAKWISGLIAGAGGVGAVVAASLGHLVQFPAGVQVALTAGAAVLLSLAVFSIALVVSADLQARATSTAAQYHARGQVAAAYESLQRMTSSPQGDATTAPVTVLSSDLSISLFAVAAANRQVQARVNADDSMLYVTGVRYKSGKLRVRLSANADTSASQDKWYELGEIDEFDTTL